MRMLASLLVVFMLMLAPVAEAAAPRISPRPKPRDPREVQMTRPLSVRAPVRVYYRATIRPKPRSSAIGLLSSLPSSSLPGSEVEVGGPSTGLATTIPVFQSPRPPARPYSLRHSSG